MKMKSYTSELTGRIFKTLPLMEDNKEEGSKYLNSLLLELHGSEAHFEDNTTFSRIMFSLEGIKDISDFNVCRTEILKCVNLCNKLKEEVE